MRARHADGEEGCKVGARSAVGQDASDETIAERRGVGGKALRPAEPVAGEAIGQYREVFPLEPAAFSKRSSLPNIANWR